jgi:diacylglycerol kinase family enzyme
MPNERVGNRVFIAFNSKAGVRDPRKREMVHHLAEALSSRGLHAEIMSDRDALTAAANTEPELHAVVAAGGDGTVSDLVNRIRPDVPVAVLPLGTENLLARYFHIPRNAEAIADIVAAQHAIKLDAGRANGRLFLLMAGCGFDADVVERLHAKRQGHISLWSYAKPIVASIRKYDYPPFTVTCRLSNSSIESGIEHSFEARWLFISNLPCYAGKLCFSPGAKGTDGRLDVCAFQGRTSWAGWRYLAAVFVQRHDRMNDCMLMQATQIKISAQLPVPYQLDGDPGGTLPLTIDILPQRMTLLVPKERLDSSITT